MSEEAVEYGEIDWGTEIKPSTGRDGFVTLPDGEEVIYKIHKAHKAVSSNGNPMMKLELICSGTSGKAYVRENVTLSQAAMSRVREFGESIGHLKPGLPGHIYWDNLVGLTGRAKLTIETWTKRDGTEGSNNKVKTWLPAEAEADGEVSFG